MKKRNILISGFSLVEVVLALGVVVFCLVTTLGLLAIGVNSTHVSTVQTAATNILTAVASDVEATPNISIGNAKAKGSVSEPSQLYGIVLPAGGTGTSGAWSTSSPSSPQTIYIGEDGTVATATTALYQLKVWTRASTTKQQETFVRLLITWPAQAAYTTPQGYVESVLAINRT